MQSFTHEWEMRQTDLLNVAGYNPKMISLNSENPLFVDTRQISILKLIKLKREIHLKIQIIF